VIRAKVTADQVSYALKLAQDNATLGGGTRDSLHHSILKKLSSILSTSQSECMRRGRGELMMTTGKMMKGIQRLASFTPKIYFKQVNKAFRPFLKPIL